MTRTAQEILQAYFHQDWQDEFGSIEHAVDAIVQGNSINVVIQLTKDFEDLLSTYGTDEAMANKLQELACDYVPTDTRAWVGRLLLLIGSRLRSAAPER